MYGYFLNRVQLCFNGSLIIVFILSSVFAFPQTKTNLEVFYSLTDSLVNKITTDIPDKEKEIILTLNLGDSYSIFSNNIKSGLQNYGEEIHTISPEGQVLPEVNLNLTEAKVKYENAERNGWFGDYCVMRMIYIKGNYLTSASEKGLREFCFVSVDSVKVEDIKTLENDSFPFTKGEIPPEPFFTSLWEPVIAIGVAAVTVILFFSVRSK